jgi:tryptophan synthase alpha chain
MRKHQLDTVFLAAPTSPDERLKAICEASRGFVYAVSRTGITGTRQEVAADASGLVKRIKQFTSLPVAVGFGISNAQQFAEVTSFAEAASCRRSRKPVAAKWPQKPFTVSLRVCYQGLGNPPKAPQNS